MDIEAIVEKHNKRTGVFRYYTWKGVGKKSYLNLEVAWRGKSLVMIPIKFIKSKLL